MKGDKNTFIHFLYSGLVHVEPELGLFGGSTCYRLIVSLYANDARMNIRQFTQQFP